MPIQSTDPTLPNFARPEYMAALPDLQLMADVLGGTRTMHANSKRYIKKWERESDAIYDRRRTCETFFEGTAYTLGGGVGMLYSKPTIVEWNGAESAVAPLWSNLDAAGTAGEIMMKRYGESALRDGFAIFLTSFPEAPKDVNGKPILIHAGNQDEYGIRPSVQLYTRAQAINWFVETIQARSVLTRLVLMEFAAVRDGQFGVKMAERYRVLSLVVTNGMPTGVQWQLFEYQEDATGKVTFADRGAGIYTDDKGNPVKALPVAIGYAGRTDAPLTATIPLLGVANANIAHWRKSSAIEWYEELCAYPQRVIKGRLADGPDGKQPTELPSGPGHAIHLEDADGDASWDELDGTSLAQLKESRQEKLLQMGQMGSGFLTPDKRGVEAVESKRLDAVAEQANILTAGQGIQDGGNLMLEQLCGLMMIPKAQAATLTINTDFERSKLTAQEMDSWIRFGQAGYGDREMIWDVFEEGDRLPRGFDRERARTAIANESPVAMPSLSQAAQAMPTQRAAPSDAGPRFAVGDRVVALVNHMDGMEGMAGSIAEVHDGDPPYYAINFDEPMGEGNPHKWLNEDEIEAESAARPMADAAHMAM